MIAGEGAIAPLSQDVARLREAVEAFRGRPKIGRSQEQISHDLSQVRVICDLIELEFSDLASEFAATDEYDQQGFDSPISWLKQVCHMSSGAAGDRVCDGEQRQRLGAASTRLICSGRRASSTSFRSATPACTLGMRPTPRVS